MVAFSHHYQYIWFFVNSLCNPLTLIAIGNMTTKTQSFLTQAWRPRLTLVTAMLACGVAWAVPLMDKSSSKSFCHCMPTDGCWPSDSDWSKLNVSVGGRLVKTQPIGSPCHDPTYDAAKCLYLQQQWTTPELQ